MKKVAIQGVCGCFHEQAARSYYGNDIGIYECTGFEDLFDALVHKMADAAVIAIENTTSCGLSNNYSLLYKYNKKIKGEIILPIRQNLMAMPGQEIREIKEVYTHYMAIAQTRNFFKQYPHIHIIDSEDTAKSALLISEEKLMNTAAVGSAMAAKLFGLEILCFDIHDNKENYTRFLVIDDYLELSEKEITKSSICFTLPHWIGSLSKVLSVFALYGLNLTKIESLPVPGKEWQYFFYGDLVFDNYDLYKKALTIVRPFVDDLTIMGEYKNNLVLN